MYEEEKRVKLKTFLNPLFDDFTEMCFLNNVLNWFGQYN